MSVQLHHGDCLEFMRTLPAGSVDAVVTDPPYGLSNAVGRKRMSDRVYEALIKIGFPKLYQRHTELLKDAGFDSVSADGAGLGGELGAVGKVAGVSVPERAIHFNGNFAVNHEINNGSISTGGRVSDCILPDEVDTEPAEFLGNFILKLRHMDAAGLPLDKSSGCIAEAFTRGFAVPIFAKIAASCPSLKTGSVSVVFGNDAVRLDYSSASETKASPFVLTFSGAVNTLMLRFDARGWPVELLATHRAYDFDGACFEGGAELIRADATASSLASMSQPARVRFVVNTADGARSFYFHVLVPLNAKVEKIIPSGGFMGKDWDAVLPDPQIWRECLRVLKPGGHLLAFCGTRTYHRLACDIEDAGFEIRDMIAWVYGSGFPKSHNLSDEWQGWGTALKPALEPITVARKPLEGTVAANVMQWGTGAINVDACRVAFVSDVDKSTVQNAVWSSVPNDTYGKFAAQHSRAKLLGADSTPDAGRWPANLIHDGSDEVVELFPQTTVGGARAVGKGHAGLYDKSSTFAGSEIGYGDTGSAARFFYCAKASKRDRDDGLEGMENRRVATLNAMGDDPESGIDPVSDRFTTIKRNHHPTVKPTELMRYLCRLVTPPAGIVFDPFAGSGSTGRGAVLEGFSFIGCEISQEYFEIARKRIEAAQMQPALEMVKHG